MARIDRDHFISYTQSALGDCFTRAQIVFDNYGELFSWNVTNAFLHAIRQGNDKIKEVLTKLEEHWENHLKLHDPDFQLCATTQETELMFRQIYHDILKLHQIQKA